VTDLTGPLLPELTCDEVRDLAAAYVLGALEVYEADAIRAHLATCGDRHIEMDEFASVLPVLTESIPVVEPPAALKGRIMAAAAADLAARGNVAAPTVAAPSRSADAVAPTGVQPVPFPSATEREARAARRTGPVGTWGLRIAAVLAIALLGGWNLLLQGQLEQTRTYEANVAAVLDVAGRPGSLTAILTAEGGDGPAGLAAVGSDGVVRLAMRDLAPTQGDQVYTTWVIGADGAPVALGDFRVGATGTAYFEGRGLPTEDGIVLALTLEPQPGATAPSSTPVSLGTASAAG
jgi:anti-sigma-K factor RskA